MSIVERLRDVRVLDRAGQPVRLATLFEERTVVLVFVRHFG